MTSKFPRRARRAVPALHTLACLALPVGSAFAQADPAATAEPIVITGTREPMSPTRLAADVVVIDRETIRNTTADSVADLLRREAGLQLSRSGGPGQPAALFVRGAASSQTAVFVDGVRIGSATLGSPSLEGIALAQVDRIEVLRGPGSSLYGADAVGGVINILTKRGEGPAQFDAHAAAGGDGSRQLSAGASGARGPWDLAASVAHEASDGVSALRPGDAFGNYNPDRDGYRLDSAQARVGLAPAAGQRIGLALFHSMLDTHYDASEFLPPAFVQDSSPDFRTRLRSTVAALDWRGALAPGWTGSAKVSRSTDASHSGGTVETRYATTRDSVSGQLALAAGALGQLVFAVDHLSEKVESGDIGPQANRRRNTGTLVELTGSAGPWSWQADARHDEASDFGSVDTGRVGGAFAFAPGWKLRALAGTSFRAPTFNDLYYPGYGVAALKPERGRSIELGLGWTGPAAGVQATVYDSRVRDQIAYASDPARCPDDPAYAFGCAANIGHARMRGATLSGTHRRGAWAFDAQLDWLDAKDADTGERLPRRAAQQQSLGVRWTGGAFGAGLGLLHLGARPEGGRTLSAETTLDLQAQWRFAAGWTLEARLLNATDADTEPALDYQGLGRQAWLGVRWQGGL